MPTPSRRAPLGSTVSKKYRISDLGVWLGASKVQVAGLEARELGEAIKVRNFYEPPLCADQIGAAGSRIEIVSVAFPESGTGAQMIEGTPEAAAKMLVNKLRTEARVL